MLLIIWAGLAAVNAKPLRLVTAIFAESGTVVPEILAETVTVPPMTMTPDHVRLPVPWLLATTTPLVSRKVQFDTVTPDDGVTVQVVLLPRAMEVVQYSLATEPGEPAE